jgi:hypothetical protein
MRHHKLKALRVSGFGFPGAVSGGSPLDSPKRSRTGQTTFDIADKGMKLRDSAFPALFFRHHFALVLLGISALAASTAPVTAGSISVPNFSFETPPVPPVTPYASPDIDNWGKSPQPAWYEPSNNSNTPWDYLMGQFYNVPFPGEYIDNCDGAQAAFLFAVPDAALFQDYNSIYGTNTAPTHAFNATFNVGSSYDLLVGAIGGGGAMQPNVTLQVGLYYVDSASNKVTVAATTITNSPEQFPTNTHFVDFQVHAPVVNQSDPWAGQHIGIQLLSSVGFDLAGGYWDVDNVRLTETLTGSTLVNPTMTNNQFTCTVLSPPGLKFEILAATSLSSSNWTSMGTFTNVTGTTSYTDTTATVNQRYYRVHQL